MGVKMPYPAPMAEPLWPPQRSNNSLGIHPDNLEIHKEDVRRCRRVDFGRMYLWYQKPLLERIWLTIRGRSMHNTDWDIALEMADFILGIEQNRCII